MGKYKHIITKLTEDSEYQKFFMDALKKFNVSDIGSFKSEDEKKKFFDYVDANYKGKTESTIGEANTDWKSALIKKFGKDKDAVNVLKSLNLTDEQAMALYFGIERIASSSGPSHGW